KHYPDKVYSTEWTDMWNRLNAFILFPHAWVRLLISRLYGIYFTGIEPETMLVKDTQAETLLNSGTVVELSNKFVIQLKSNYLDATLGTQIVKNLVFLSRCLYHT